MPFIHLHPSTECPFIHPSKVSALSAHFIHPSKVSATSAHFIHLLFIQVLCFGICFSSTFYLPASSFHPSFMFQHLLPPCEFHPTSSLQVSSFGHSRGHCFSSKFWPLHPLPGCPFIRGFHPSAFQPSFVPSIHLRFSQVLCCVPSSSFVLLLLFMQVVCRCVQLLFMQVLCCVHPGGVPPHPPAFQPSFVSLTCVSAAFHPGGVPLRPLCFVCVSSRWWSRTSPAFEPSFVSSTCVSAAFHPGAGRVRPLRFVLR